MLSDVRLAAADLIAAALGVRGPLDLRPLAGGANNRVFRADLGTISVLLKVYFQHPHDRRDRLHAEFAFASFAWDHGLRCLPQPLGSDPRQQLGLYAFVAGRALRPDEIDATAVGQALNFYQELNRHKAAPAATALPAASEACFSIAEHLACVEWRIQTLRTIEEATPLDREAARFIHDELVPAWERVTHGVRRRADALGLALEQPIAERDRCLSPSDFGYHNAILAEDGRLRFIDFEYAGWDDPAKLACDFFCQPALPVPPAYYDQVVAAVVADLSTPELHSRRIALLLPVYQVKWCCILLNDFLPAGSARRRFAHSPAGQEERKAGQLAKTRHAFHSME